MESWDFGWTFQVEPFLRRCHLNNDLKEARAPVSSIFRGKTFKEEGIGRTAAVRNSMEACAVGEARTRGGRER